MDSWWLRVRPRLTLVYLAVALILLVISGAGHLRLLQDVGKVFGGFTWTIDPDSHDELVIIAIPPQLQPLEIPANSLTSNIHIIAVNGVKGVAGIEQAYQHEHEHDPITYLIQQDQQKPVILVRPAEIFTLDMWGQMFGLAFLAGLSWLLVGGFLLATASEWSGAVEGLTLLPPAILVLLYSHWGNIQQPYAPDLAIQLMWIPSFALLGAAFIHLSLIYRPETLKSTRTPSIAIDVLPYLPLLALLAYEWSSLLLFGHAPMRFNILVSLSYGVIGGLISLSIGLTSLLRIAGMHLPWRKRDVPTTPIAPHIRHRLGDLLTLWIGGVGLGFCFGVLPILLVGKTLLPLPIFYTLATIYPLILLYAIRSIRLVDRLHVTLNQRELALREQQQTAGRLQQTNRELQQATSLLLHADAHLRSILSQRIHDQPKQQALRIRSLLGHWQHKLRVETEHDTTGKVNAQPIIEMLGKVRKLSEELEGDLRGLQLLVEDIYQRRSLGLKLHLEKLIREDLPLLHPESPLQVKADLWALDNLSPDLEQTDEGERFAEAISFTITQALLNVYNHAGASFATVQTTMTQGMLEVRIKDDGRGFDPDTVTPDKTSMFKAQLKAREAGGQLITTSILRPQPGHGTTVTLRLPLPSGEDAAQTTPGSGQPQATPSTPFGQLHEQTAQPEG